MDIANKMVTKTEPQMMVNTDETKWTGLFDSSLAFLILFINFNDS